MGYTTEFLGGVEISPPLNEAESIYLRAFAETRRMERDRGPYFVGGSGYRGQVHDEDVSNFNAPPTGQPGLWCQWVPNEDGTALEWDGGEKFYEADQWMSYLIEHFLKPEAHASASGDPRFAEFSFNHVLNGEIEANGDDPDDRWLLRVSDNEVFVLDGNLSYVNQRRITPEE